MATFATQGVKSNCCSLVGGHTQEPTAWLWDSWGRKQKRGWRVAVCVGHNTQGLPAASWSHLQLNRFILLHLQLLLLGGFPSTAHLCRLFSDCKVEGLSCLTAKLCLYHLTPLSPGTEHCLWWQQGRRKINYHKAVDPVHSNQFIPAPKT